MLPLTLTLVCFENFQKLVLSYIKYLSLSRFVEILKLKYVGNQLSNPCIENKKKLFLLN